jgi:uncharacterized membrane protein
VFASLVFLGVWMALNRPTGLDPIPFILLNLVLGCLAALQGAILLIAAKRSDQIASEPARQDYEADARASDVVEQLLREVAALRVQQSRRLRLTDGQAGNGSTGSRCLTPAATRGTNDRSTP